MINSGERLSFLSYFITSAPIEAGGYLNNLFTDNQAKPEQKAEINSQVSCFLSPPITD